MQQQQEHRPGYIEKAAAYLRNREKEPIEELAQSYPNDTRSLFVDLTEVERHDVDLGDAVRENPQGWIPQFEAALPHTGEGEQVDISTPIDLDGAHVRFITAERERVSVGRINEKQGGEYVGVRGILQNVGKQVERIDRASFVCERCGVENVVPQVDGPTGDDELQEPYQCESCEREGPFRLNVDQSEFTDFRKLRIAQQPGEGASGDQLEIDAYVEDDAVNVDCDVRPEDGEPLSYRAGETVVAHGILERAAKGSDSALFEFQLDARAITFEGSQKEIADVSRSELADVATQSNSSQIFRDDMSPGTYETDHWQIVKKVAEAFLFAAPTIDIEGEGKRGNIHFAIFGDPGLNKSQFMQSLRKLSVESAHVSANGKQVSEVGFTAGAIKDEFGDGGFSLKPGVLPRAGWHAFIDEIDKFDGDVTSLNDALEFPQRIAIEKAGIRAQLDTDVGVMVMGNPEGGRFEPEADPWQQIRSVVDPSLLSRFDAVIPLRDIPDEAEDKEIAEHIVEHNREQARRAAGELDAEDADLSKREHRVEFLRAWIQEGRDIDPLLTDAAADLLVEFFPQGRGDGDSRRPNYTFRKLDAGIRLAKAYARRDLSEDATVEHAQEAIDVLEPLIGMTHSEGEGLNPDVLNGTNWQTNTNTQKGRKEAIKEAANGNSIEQIADATGLRKGLVEDEVEKMMQKGLIYEPENNQYRST